MAGGHVFVVQGDLTRLACDAWLVPSDAENYLAPAWTAALEDVDLPPPSGARATRLADDALGTQRWLVDMGGHSGTLIDWFLDGVTHWVGRAAAEIGPRRGVNGRALPLLAPPVVGTGAGGAKARSGALMRSLLGRLTDLAAAHEVDIALVTWDERAYAAAQAARRALAREGADPWRALEPRLRIEADRLGEQARDGRLVLFLGAGVSIGAGCPSWDGLLGRLAKRSGMGPEQIARLRDLPAIDQARVAQRRVWRRRAGRRDRPRLRGSPAGAVPPAARLPAGTGGGDHHLRPTLRGSLPQRARRPRDHPRHADGRPRGLAAEDARLRQRSLEHRAHARGLPALLGPPRRARRDRAGAADHPSHALRRLLAARRQLPRRSRTTSGTRSAPAASGGPSALPCCFRRSRCSATSGRTT